MKLLEVTNGHLALPAALALLDKHGVRRDSRNGPVVLVPGGVTTVYSQPLQRVVFWPERDCNPFLHLYESLWTIAGRDDVASLVEFTKNYSAFSDDGETLHGAYGKRWRDWFGKDQIELVVAALRKNPDDRRCILQMWDAAKDLGRQGKDVPCNQSVAVQRDEDGKLDITVFCRSNDVVWGAYGANFPVFSMLQDYLATRIGCPVGTYTQVSVNWHGYLKTLEPLKALPRASEAALIPDPYDYVVPLPLPRDAAQLEREIFELIDLGKGGVQEYNQTTLVDSLWARDVAAIFRAHHIYKHTAAPERFEASLRELRQSPAILSDWNKAAREWIQRRQKRWEEKQ